jgi:hypothetical protein
MKSRRMSTHYELIIYWSNDDDSFIVEVPELPAAWPTVKRTPTQSQTQKS